MGVRSTVRFLTTLWATNLKAAMALRGALWVQIVSMALNDLIFMVIWVLLFDRYDHVGGWRLPDMAALYGTIAAGFGLSALFLGGTMRLSNFVLEGRLDVVLVQPKDPLLHLAASRMVASGLGDVVAGVFLLAVSGLVGPSTAPLALLGVVASGVVFSASAALFHSLVFFLGPAPIARQLHEFLIAFSSYPETIAVGFLRLVLFTALPAAFAAWFPVRLLRDFTGEALLLCVAGVVLYSTLAAWVFRLGLRRYESSGRFGAAL